MADFGKISGLLIYYLFCSTMGHVGVAEFLS